MLRLLLIFGLAAIARPEETTIRTDEDAVPKIPDVSIPVSEQLEYEDERQARMSLQTESPTAKARREQALRNILVARRRKIMRQRTSSESAAASRRSSSRRGKPAMRDQIVADLLEMQESQNGLYVTVPEQQSGNETQEIVIETLSGPSSGISISSSSSSSNTNPRRNTTKPYRGNSPEHRGKKIVAMPASLYNHFRPVESNIPIEDMSQFLYFGQKLRGTGMGKDSSPASPSPKKLLAGLEAMLDDDMNSVDKSSNLVSSKPTKMRTMSLREHTTRPACPDKMLSEARGNSINATMTEKNLDTPVTGLRIVVTEGTTIAPTSSSETISTNTDEISNTTTSTTTTTVAPSSTTTQETVKATLKHQEQHVTERQRAALRNSSVAETGGSSSLPGSSRLSAGATVEQAATPQVATAAPQQQPGFTIRWTDARPASKRRRLAASRRRDKSARAMDEQQPSTPGSEPVFPVTPRTVEMTSISTSTTTTTTTAATTSTATDTSAPITSSVTETATEITTTDKELPTTTLTPRMLDPSEVQKMYRSGSSSSTSTIKPETTSAEVPTIPPQEEPTSRSPERSPEVRGRNLADKAKDDVLPIMQLYNTSSMFNASENPTIESTRTMNLSTTTPTATTTIIEPTSGEPSTARPNHENSTSTSTTSVPSSTTTTTTTSSPRPSINGTKQSGSNRTGSAKPHTREFPGESNGSGYYPLELNNGYGYGVVENRTFFQLPGPREPLANISEVISRRHDGDALASQETVAVVSYILATLVVFPIAVGVGLILRRLIIRNRKVLEESDTSSEISCRKDALNLETGDFKLSIEKNIRKLPRIQHLCHEAEKPPPPSSQESHWEFSRDKLRLQTVLGEGNFGQVWKAEADDLTGHQGTTRLVAVKTVKEGASDREKEDLIRELEIMQRVGNHPNVVTLLGCCTEQEPHYLILEYVMYGKLLAYLRDHRTRQDFYNFSEDSAALTSRDLTVFGYCVARGMEYLASKKIIHRDLAARNVLVDHNKLCKIADFGMSRFANEDGEVIETRHGRNALPIRWMAPESLIYSLFTTKTDVWSFGILMWEIVTLGSTPYPDMTAREVMRSVQNGYRLERPSHCRSELFRVIARCWHADPDRRPEFQVLRRDLAQLLEDNMNGHYVDLESFASECTD